MITFEVGGKTYSAPDDVELGQLEDMQGLTSSGSRSVMEMLSILVRPLHPEVKPEDFRRLSVKQANKIVANCMASYGLAKPGEVKAQGTS